MAKRYRIYYRASGVREWTTLHGKMPSIHALERLSVLKTGYPRHSFKLEVVND